MSTEAPHARTDAVSTPTDVLTFGETMAALRATGPLRLGGTLGLSVAGAESNVAIGLARLGHRVRWAGLTGADEFGHLVLRTLRAEGVDVSRAATGRGPTGLLVFEPRVADLTRVHYYRSRSAATDLGPDHVRAALADGARIVHVTGVTAALGEVPRLAVVTAVREARRTGALVCLDVNQRDKLWSRAEAAACLRPLADGLALVVASDDELELVAPEGARTERDQVTALLDLGVREVVVKRGASGAEVFSAAGRESRPAVPVPVRDTVGAGDAFVAGYLSALLDGADPAGRLERAVTTGAFAVACEGDWEGLPRRDELSLLSAAPGSALR
ncbi:sugar kinase [Streptomyces sp. NA04227]|uniref:sugar kinase n=1 Tax=Streptomyces sp. NA04227 TaxID=2742136 RepID=UPI0015923653|nr:sugar kinase [Streptomyces sp. NA04227]QKW10293.1 sugar kinase [Streptomyces sp. NA04227]